MDAARRANVRVGMVFNYRFVPAVMRAKQLIDEGFLGQIYHFHFEYLHPGYQSPERPMDWKLRKSQSGGGALVDLGSHIIDYARYLVGDFVQVRATTRTYIAERPRTTNSTERERVDVDDAAWVQAKLTNGAQCELMLSRLAMGTLDDLRFEVYGERGALRFSLMDANWQTLYDGKISDEPLGGTRGWMRVETVSRYAGASSPPPRSILGWNRTHTGNLFAFMKAVTIGEEPVPNALDELHAHEVIDAAYQSAESRKWGMVERG